MRTACISLIVGLFVLAMTVPASAEYTVLLVSDCWAPDDPTPDKPHEDDPFVAWLEGLPGITVDTYGMAQAMRGNFGADDLAAVAACDLIVLSRRTDSGAYNVPQQWNGIEKPLILCSGYLTRSSRWGWSTGGSGDAGRTETDMAIALGMGGHDFFNKEHSLTDPVALFDWTPFAQSPKGVYAAPANEMKDAANAVLGTIDVDPNTVRVVLADYPKGFDFDEGGELKYGAAGGNRAFLAQWGYDFDLGDPINRRAQWDDCITDDHKNLLENMILTKIPEPTTLALLGLGGLAALLRRKKH